MRDELDFTPQERAAILTWYLSQGHVFTSARAAQMVGLKHPRSARKLLGRLARVLPITCNEEGVWRVGTARESTSILEDVFVVYDKDGTLIGEKVGLELRAGRIIVSKQEEEDA